jgi:hypothetical protein
LLSTGTLGTFGTTNTGSLFGTQNKLAFGTGTSTNPFGTSTGTGLFGNSSLGFATGSTLGQTSTLGGGFAQPSKIIKKHVVST